MKEGPHLVTSILKKAFDVFSLCDVRHVAYIEPSAFAIACSVLGFFSFLMVSPLADL